MKVKVFLTLLSISFLLTLNAQKPRTQTGLEIDLPRKTLNYYYNGNMRVNSDTGTPIAIYNIKHKVNEDMPENMAKQYLQDNTQVLKINQDLIDDLKLHHTRTTLSGTTIRLRQYVNNLPVNKSEITVTINKENEVIYVMNDLSYDINIKNLATSYSIENAKQIAYSHLNINNNITYENQELFIHSSKNDTRLAYRINVMSHDILGEWEVFIDAKTGEIFKAEDVSFYCFDNHEEDDKNKTNKTTSTAKSMASALATGTGNVFDPDPLSSATVAYGTGGYTDNNDANSADLTSQTFTVSLNDITFSGGMYYLEGPFAEIVDNDTPSNGLFEQATNNFEYQRNDNAFEAVNVYYHIDASMRFINNTLGISLMPYQYATGVRADPSGAQGADNSFYSSGTGGLVFGEGCVDDGEDSDVIHHELGHGLHDWVTAGGLSQEDGLSEGCGDYWAQSYNRSLNNWTSSDAAYNYVFNWDGHNTCWAGRTTGYTASYPGGLVGQIHTDGQIWATCLMKIYDLIGKTQTDKIFFEGLAMTNSSSSQNDAAVAAYQAAISMSYPQSEIQTIYDEFTDCGYTLPEAPAAPIADFSADNTFLCIDSGPVVVNFSDLTSGVPTSWSWSFEGGTPSTSTAQNPSVTYTAVGSYQVVLTATNSIDSDTETKVGYINIVSGAACPACVPNSSTDTPLTISSIGTPTITSEIVITDTGTITDVNILDLNILHTYVADLDISITSPNGTTVILAEDQCTSSDNYLIDFDDDASSGTIPCPPTDGQAYQPSGSLSDFNGESANGTWTLTIFDDFNQDGGSLESWKLEICTEPTLSLNDNILNEFTVYPNPNNGSFNVRLNGQTNEDINIIVFDIRGRQIFNSTYQNTSDFNETINLNDVHSGVYLMKINSGEKRLTKKLIIK